MRLTEQEVIATVQQISLRRLRLWVRNGWIAPAVGAEGPTFDEADVARIRLVCQLKDDLNLNEDAIPVVLSLMDQLYGLRRELKTLVRAIDSQPHGVRNRIRSAYNALIDR